MTLLKDLNRIKELEKDISYFSKFLTSDSKEKESYKIIVEDKKKELETLQDKRVSKGVKSKGICDMSVFEGKPILTVSIDKSFTKRNLYDSIRKSWLNVSMGRIQKLVDEHGFVVGVINKVVMGVVQVEGYEMYDKKKYEKSERVGFIGKLLDNHPSIGMSIKERTVTGPIQGFNFDN